MSFNLRSCLVAVASILLAPLWAQDHGDHSHSAKDHLYEAARDPAVSWEEAYARAVEEEVEKAFLVEAQTIHYLSSGNMPELYRHLDELEAVS